MPTFTGWRDSACSAGLTRRHRAGMVLVGETIGGDRGDDAGRRIRDGKGGAVTASLQPGDFFGELALLDGAPHSATATAVEAVETLSLARAPFHQLLDADRGLRVALLSGLAAELRRLTQHVEELHFLDLAGRLVMRLVRLARDRDAMAEGEVRLDWPFTQSDLAAMIGGTRQSVNKLLSQLVDDGLLVIEHETLVIKDLHALAERAER